MVRLFEACPRFELEPCLATSHYAEEPSCISCLYQYTERVCPEFQRRLLTLAALPSNRETKGAA